MAYDCGTHISKLSLKIIIMGKKRGRKEEGKYVAVIIYEKTSYYLIDDLKPTAWEETFIFGIFLLDQI